MRRLIFLLAACLGPQIHLTLGQVCFYVADESDEVYAYNFQTQTDHLVCNLPPGVTSAESLAYDPVRAVLYSAFEGKIIEINPRNCLITEQFSISFQDVDAIEYFNDTIVIAVRALNEADSVVTYRLSTGEILHGPFAIKGPGVPLNIDGLALNPCDVDGERKLFATLNNEGNGDSLFCINPSTGSHTLVGAMSTSDIESISFTAKCELFAVKGKKPSSIWYVDQRTADLSQPVTLSGGDVEGFACDPIDLFFKDGHLVQESFTKVNHFDVQNVTLAGLEHFPGVEIEIERKFQNADLGTVILKYSLSDGLSEVEFGDEVPSNFSDVTYSIILASADDRPILAEKRIDLSVLDHDAMRIFPNPTSQILQLQLNVEKESDLRFVIRDQLGKPMLSKVLDGKQIIHSLDVTALPFGYYSIEVSGAEQILFDRFFIAR